MPSKTTAAKKNARPYELRFAEALADLESRKKLGKPRTGSFPFGHYEGASFHLNPDDRRECCKEGVDGVNLFTHAVSAHHVAHVHNVDTAQLKKAARKKVGEGDPLERVNLAVEDALGQLRQMALKEAGGIQSRVDTLLSRLAKDEEVDLDEVQRTTDEGIAALAKLLKKRRRLLELAKVGDGGADDPES